MDTLVSGERVEITSTDPGFPRDAAAWCSSTGNQLISKDTSGGKSIVVIEKGEPKSCNIVTSCEGKGKTFIMFSDDLDKALATFVLANGAAATGQKVTIFFTFWGLNVIKKLHKPETEKDIFGKMFGMMLPSSSKKLKLSKMSMGGMGGKMMRYIMNKKGIDSLESLRQQALENGLEQRINSPQTRDLVRRLNLAAITVLNNKNHILPLHTDKEQTIALLEVGDPGETDALAKQLSRYTSLARFSLRANQTEEKNQRLRDSLSTYKRIIVAVSEQRLAPYQPFFAKFVPESPAIYLFFTPGKMMLQIQRAVAHASAVVLGHSYSSDVQRQVADVLFAKASADGQLSASLGELFPTGAGVTITPKTPLHFVPEEYGLSSAHLKRIDSIALDGIRQGAYPGCQVVVLKNGHIMFDKAFGTYTGKGSPRVESTNIYDLASLSKTTGTLLAIMKLYDKGRFNLTDKISDHLPFLQRTDKKDITIQEILYHQSGLPSWIPFYQEAIDKDSYDGRLFSARKDVHHPVQIGTTTWANPKFKFKSEYISPVKTGDYTVQICDSLWLNRSFRKVIEEKIAEAPLKQKRYVYSDVGFILLGMLVEQLAGMPMEAYLQREFYEPMGLEHTGYLPLRRFAKSEIVPSNKDRFLRKETLQGFVHDEASAFFGGLAGNAGLFSTARDVARVYQMLLNGGEIDGQRYLSKETCQLFTTETSKISRRGLGFDKPDADDPKKGNCAPAAPAEVYGHTGFTGTCAWVDPMNELVYVFLSNRIYPDVTNRKLNQLHIRERIQGAIYDAMKKK